MILYLLGNLAWTVYKSCKGAPGSFQNISSEVLSLYALLQETREALSAHPLPASKQANLGTILGGCQGVLDDLQSLIEKYKSLGTQSKRTWDRLGWGTNDIAEIRARLTSSAGLLAAYLRRVHQLLWTAPGSKLTYEQHLANQR